MHGEKQQMWLTKLKIAIVEKDTDALSELVNDIPKLTDKKDIEEALYLSREALEILYTLKDETASNMTKIKKNISFLRSTDIPVSRKLDIKL